MPKHYATKFKGSAKPIAAKSARKHMSPPKPIATKDTASKRAATTLEVLAKDRARRDKAVNKKKPKK